MVSVGSGVPRVRFREEYWFPISPAQMWDTIEQYDRYPLWWTWLRQFTAHPDGCGIDDGVELRGVVVPPLPYRLSVHVTLDRCLRPALIDASVDGDLRGDASLRLAAAGDGTRATVAWTLEMVSPPLRIAARLAFPVVRWGHDQVVAMAVAGFRHRALAPVTV